MKGGNRMKKDMNLSEQEAFAVEEPLSLKDLLEHDLDLLRLDNIRIVYFQQEGNWHSRCFLLPVNSRDITSLKWIANVDEKAVAMCGHDFIEKGTNVLDEMASMVVARYKDTSSYNNIYYFLKYCERKQQEMLQQQAQPISPKLDKQHFLQSKAGEAFTHTARLCYFSKKFNLQEEEYWSIAINRLLAILHYCYGVEYCMVMDDDGVSIKTQDGTDVLYHYTEKE